jgi:hypothetical protein
VKRYRCDFTIGRRQARKCRVPANPRAHRDLARPISHSRLVVKRRSRRLLATTKALEDAIARPSRQHLPSESGEPGRERGSDAGDEQRSSEHARGGDPPPADVDRGAGEERKRRDGAEEKPGE